MAHFNTSEEFISPKSRFSCGKARPIQKILATSVLLTASLTITCGVAADDSNVHQPEGEKYITGEQQRKLVDWSLQAHADLSGSLNVKLHAELISKLDPSGKFQDTQVPVIEFPEQELICSSKATSVQLKQGGSPGDCYVANHY